MLLPSDHLAYMESQGKQSAKLEDLISYMVAFFTPALEDEPHFKNLLKIFENIS